MARVVERPAALARVPGARGFIFDMDGTLVDSHRAHVRAWDKVTREHGLACTEEEIVSHFGKTTPAIAASLFQVDDPAFIARVSGKKARYFMDEVASITVLPGVIPVLERLLAMRRPACIASSNVRAAIELVLQRTGLSPFLHAVIGLDDILRGKPDPEMIVKAAVALGLDPVDCVVVGDSVYDVQSGNAAGAFTIGVLTGAAGQDALDGAGAGLVLPGVGALLPLLG